MRLLNLQTLTAILAVLSFTKAEDNAIASPDSAVVKLTSETFQGFIKENPLVLAEFFAPWCGHCKKLGPEFSSAADALATKDIKLAQIDCTEERDLCNSFGIKGYPTLKVFRGANEPAEYQGQRQSDSIVSYMTKLSLPAVSVIENSSDLLDSISELTSPMILQVLPPGATGSDANSTFYEVANALRNDFFFVSTSNDEYVKKYATDSKKPTYVVFRADEQLDDASVSNFDTFDKTHLVDFIDVESKPLFGEITGATFQSYMAANIPLAYYFWNTEAERDAVAPIITPLAKKYRGEINFVGLEAPKFGMHAKNINMEETFPLFAIHDIAGNLKYGISQDKDLDNSLIAKFVSDYAAGSLEPIVKSEEIPEVQDEAVYHLVGYEHEAIVKSGKDVLVEYYAPWCGHCKRLAPTYEELAAIYQNDTIGKEKVVVAKLDHTANDVSNLDITGYPTLFLYPGDGSEKILYEGQRSLEALADFIKEKGTYGIDALEIRDAAAAAAAVTEEVAEEAAAPVEHDEL
ncbi:hypothetical protein CANARDRAFT_200175 [[Candida] arabinofermentans NRRL YB-2248]|uniref:Protein disulfide-isomerase n=1 Tax=[Candida] arabinofermentans NRRL YB-2248 TaxID=983967 RepID=A0A1E4SZG8_9ASCO|nr:hypothetical protein CANARDRAFT_200175 [[Candida] arabinofermentans NRRL YB-2248]